MSKAQFASINTQSPDDVQELFELLCKEAILKSEEEVKAEMQTALGKEVFKTKVVSASDLMATISFYDIKFTLKVEYLPPTAKETVEPPKQGLEPNEKLLAEQQKDIADPLSAGAPKDDVPDFD